MIVRAPGEDLKVLRPEATWRLARIILQSWHARICRLRVYGKERVPRSGGYVIAANHIAGDDPLVLGYACPRSIRFMAKIELWRIPVLRTIMPHTGAFPVRRGAADRDAIRMGRDVLASGNLLGVFVEGTRQTSDEIGDARTGAAMLAVLAGAPIIPVCIYGTDRHGRNPFHPATVAWGTPIEIAGLPRGARTYRAIATAIEEELRALREFMIAAGEAGRPRGFVPPASRPRVEVGDVGAT